MLFHPIQLFTIALMFCPGPNRWVAPPRPPDAPPPSRRATIGYKIVAGFALSHVYQLIPATDHCDPDSLCFISRESLPALPAPGPSIAPRSLAPTSRPYVSLLLRTSCPVVVIPPRPAPACRNTHVHPVFEWALQSPVPSPVLAQRICSPRSLPIFPADDCTYVHSSISPFSPPRPTDAAPILSVLLLVACIICRKFLGNILAIVLAALMDLAEFVVRVSATRLLWQFKNAQHASRVLSGFVTLGIVDMIWTSLSVVQKYTSIVCSMFFSAVPIFNDIKFGVDFIDLFWGNVSSNSAGTMVPMPQLFVFDMAMNKVFAESIMATFVFKDSTESIFPTVNEFDIYEKMNLKSSNIHFTVISAVEVQIPVVRVEDSGKGKIDIAPLSPCTVLPISIPVTPQLSATDDDTISGPHQEDPGLESKLEPTLTVQDAVHDASERQSNSEAPTVKLPVVEVPDDAAPDPEQLLGPSFMVVAIPVSEVRSMHDHVASASEPGQDSPPVAPIITTTIIDVDSFVDEGVLIPELEPESLSMSSPILVTPVADDEVISDNRLSTPVPKQEQEQEHSCIGVATSVVDVEIIPDDVPVTPSLTLEPEFVSLLVDVNPTIDVQVNGVETRPLSSEDAVQQKIFTAIVDEACADEEALAAPEPSLAKYNIVPDQVTSLEDALESKGQEISEPVDGGLSLIRPGPPTTRNSMTEIAPCHSPLPVPSLPLLFPRLQTLEVSSSEPKSDPTHLPRIRRRVRRSVKRERRAEREAATALATTTAQAITAQ